MSTPLPPKQNKKQVSWDWSPGSPCIRSQSWFPLTLLGVPPPPQNDGLGGAQPCGEYQDRQVRDCAGFPLATL